MPESNPPTNADVPQPVPPAVAVVETDTYCDSCGYNLRTQPVWRDERLGVLVCRCPECGRHRAAGLATVGSLWGRRVATALLLVWVVLCTAGVIAAAGVTLGLQTEADHVLTYNELETRAGAPARSNFVHVGQAKTVYWSGDVDIEFRPGRNGQIKAYLVPGQTEVDMNGPPFVKPSDVVIRYRLADWLTGREPDVTPYGRRSARWEQAAVYVGVVALLAFAFGLIMACVCWHWRGRRWVWTLLPAAMLAISLTFARSTPAGWLPTLPTDGERLTDVVVIAAAAWQVAWSGLGLWIGRAIVRVLVRLFVPRIARTPLGFLWTADGKPPPRAVV